VKTRTGTIRRATRIGALGVGAIGLFLGLVSSGIGEVATASAASSSKSPVTIGLLWDIKGESSVDINDYQNGAMLAVKQLNKAGGVGGRKVIVFRQPLPPLDLQATVSDFLAAVGKKPTAMVGIPAPNQSQSLGTDITRAAIPVLTVDVGEPYDITGSPAGSDYAWFLGNYDPLISSSLTTYGVKDLGIKKMALLGGNDTYGQGGIDSATSTLKSLGQTPATVQQFSETATDLTPQVLAMKSSNADGVFSWSYPNTIAVQLKQMAQNGVIIPTLAGTSAEIAAESGAVPAQTLSKLSIAVPCNFGDASYSKSVASFNKAYQAAYGTPGTINAAWAYDGVMTVARAVKIANSTDPAAVNKAIPKIASTSAACGVLKADAAHVMNHQLVFAKFNGDGTNKTVKVSTLPNTKPAS
jgi:branched-chain amino acid transport system substrate-binding protein